ncbi:MAG: tetratricopeptide repeat protein, partial [Myxococcota bacterium]
SDEFADQPAVRAYLNCAIAQVYNSHGRITRSIELFEQNLPVLIDARGLGDFDVISVKNNLALAYEEAGEMERADALFQDAIGFASTLDHPASDELSRTLQINYAGKVLVALGRYDQALATYDELIQGFDKNSVESGLEYHTVRINRAQALERLGRLSDAEVALRAAIDDAESELGSRAPLVLAAMNNVASLCVMTGRIDEAVEIYASLAGTMEDVHGVGSTRASQAWLNHGQLLESSGRHQEALSVYEHAMARSRDRVPATAPVWIHLLARRGVVLSTLERTDDAIVSLTEAIQAIDRSDDGAIRPVWREMVLTFLVDALESTGATEQAATYRELLNDHVAAFGSSSPTAR